MNLLSVIGLLLYEYHYGMLEAAGSVAGLIIAYRVLVKVRTYLRKLRVKNFIPPYQDGE